MLERGANLLRLAFFVNRAVRVADLTHDVRAHECAAVRDGGHSGHELERRHGNALPDGGRRDVRVEHRFGLEEDAFLLARQVNARRLAKAEEARIVHEPLRAKREPDLRESRIERILHDVGEGHRAVALVVPVLDTLP